MTYFWGYDKIPVNSTLHFCLLLFFNFLIISISISVQGFANIFVVSIVSSVCFGTFNIIQQVCILQTGVGKYNARQLKRA